MKKEEYILCASIKRIAPITDIIPYYHNDICQIEIGYRHHDIYQRFTGKVISSNPHDQGFYTSKGRHVGRVEGMEIAFLAGQVDAQIAINKSWNDGTPNVQKYNQLYSEDLY